MAVTPDPVGAYNQSFQTADTSRRDYERLEMQRQQQAEAAVQRAREQKASDFKMMMEALNSKENRQQQIFQNDFQTKQLANQTLTAEAGDYRARNPLSRSGRVPITAAPPMPGGMAVPSFGTPGMAVPGGLDESLVNTVKGYESFIPNAYRDYKQTSVGYGTRAKSSNEVLSKEQADSRLREELGMHAGNIDSAAQRSGVKLTANQRNALISFDFNTGEGGNLLQTSNGDLNEVKRRLLLYNKAGKQKQELAGLVKRRNQEAQLFDMPDAGVLASSPPAMPIAANQPVALQPPDLSVGDTTPLLPPPAASAAYAAPAAPAVPPAAPSAPVIPGMDMAMAVPGVATAATQPTQPMPPTTPTPMPQASPPGSLMRYMTDKAGFTQTPQVPTFDRVDVSSQGRDQLQQLAEAQATLESRQREALRVQQRIGSDLRYVDPSQDEAYRAAYSTWGEEANALAGQASRLKLIADQKAADGKILETRQMALNKLGGLNNVLPSLERDRIINEAKDPRNGLAEAKIATLQEYEALRRQFGLTNRSRGFATAQNVVDAAREMQTKDAIAQRDSAAEAASIKALIAQTPETEDKLLEVYKKKAAEAQVNATLYQTKVAKFQAAIDADTIKSPAPESAVAPGATPAAATSGIDRSKGRDILSNREKVDQANQTARNEYWGANTADVAQQVFMDGGRDEEGNIVPPFSVALLEKIAEGKTSGPGFRGGQAGAPQYADTIVKQNLSNWTPTKGDRVNWGRETQPTAQDFLKVAAKQRLKKIAAGAVANGPLSPEKKKEAEQFPIK